MTNTAVWLGLPRCLHLGLNELLHLRRVHPRQEGRVYPEAPSRVLQPPTEWQLVPSPRVGRQAPSSSRWKAKSLWVPPGQCTGGTSAGRCRQRTAAAGTGSRTTSVKGCSG